MKIFKDNSDGLEHFCSPKIAELLKKNGFNSNVRSFYRPDWMGNLRAYNLDFGARAYSDELPRPTHSEAIEWLRRYKKIFIGLDVQTWVNGVPFYRANIEYFKDGRDTIRITRHYNDYIMGYTTPYKAIDVALKYVLRNLLKS